MTEQQARVSIFDKSFEKEGRYNLYLKSGFKFVYKKRSELWKDKTATYWVTFKIYNKIDDINDMDVRYNEISAISEHYDFGAQKNDHDTGMERDTSVAR